MIFRSPPLPCLLISCLALAALTAAQSRAAETKPTLNEVGPEVGIERSAVRKSSPSPAPAKKSAEGVATVRVVGVVLDQLASAGKRVRLRIELDKLAPGRDVVISRLGPVALLTNQRVLARPGRYDVLCSVWVGRTLLCQAWQRVNLMPGRTTFIRLDKPTMKLHASASEKAVTVRVTIETDDGVAYSDLWNGRSEDALKNRNPRVTVMRTKPTGGISLKPQLDYG